LAFIQNLAFAPEAKQIAEQEAKQAEFTVKKATQDARSQINRAPATVARFSRSGIDIAPPSGQPASPAAK
jgi:murein DD-endopeptidase MepM/ murein hydrolase activator NlpD